MAGVTGLHCHNLVGAHVSLLIPFPALPRFFDGPILLLLASSVPVLHPARPLPPPPPPPPPLLLLLALCTAVGSSSATQSLKATCSPSHRETPIAHALAYARPSHRHMLSLPFWRLSWRCTLAVSRWHRLLAAGSGAHVRMQPRAHPAGARVVILRYTRHYDESLFPDPHAFRYSRRARLGCTAFPALCLPLGE
jgi:hypothetical protein